MHSKEFNYKFLSGKWSQLMANKFAIRVIEHYRKPARRALQNSRRFHEPLHIENLAEKASKVTSLGNQCGEGWLLTANDFICSLAALVKRLAVDHLHLIGDVFDRGAHADKIMDRLVEYHSLDFQWGNHEPFLVAEDIIVHSSNIGMIQIVQRLDGPQI